jgi:hypothetical protein
MLKEPPAGGTITTHSLEMHARGHTFYKTECPAGCEMAGKWAARRLITPRAFLNAARTSNGLEGAAAVLAVEPFDVYNYVASLDPDEWLIMMRLVGRTGN